MSGLTRTTFEGARAYANGMEERFRDHGLRIVMYIGILGVTVEAYLSGDRNKTSVTACHPVISWHDIEIGLYDALRKGIDKACRDLGLSV